jgi:hypothetical protein
MYIITLNRFLDPMVVWVDKTLDPTAPHDDGQRLLALGTYEEAHDVATQVLQLLDEGRETALIFNPSLVT